MTLIGFLYIVTTKVIQHNLEKKVPIYVYYLYKNLENESKLLEKKLIDQANSTEGDAGSSSGSGTSTGNKTIEEVLKGLDAKSYCETFAEDVNLIGNIDCANSVKNVQSGASSRKTVEYSCTRQYTFNINDNGSYTETLNPIYNLTNDLCTDNKNFTDETITCNAQPTITITDLIKDNTSAKQTYTCTKKSEVDNGPIQGQFGEVFNLDAKPELSNELKNTNNIRLNFVTLSNGPTQYTAQYNLSVYVNQDEICPKLDKAEVSTYECKWTEQRNNCSAKYTTEKINFTDKGRGCWYTIKYKRASGRPTTNSCANYIKDYEFISKDINNCADYINYSIDIFSKDQHNKSYSVGAYNDRVGGTVNMYMTMNNLDMYKNYYTKWNNFFTKNSSLTKETKAAINSQSFNEGSVESISTNSDESKNYLAHFIYASIDTPFDKGEMNKNIFVFEQFGNKIIPVGYLANNANSPLKFDVITRNPQTFKIEKVNYYNGSEKRPLTFCEAMSYTGEEFSQYCGCKDGSNNVVTQYSTKNEQCNNHFGCIIRPVKPGLSGRF